VAKISTGWMTLLSANQQFQSMEGNQSTDRNQRLGIGFSSSTTKHLKEVFLPLCQFYDIHNYTQVLLIFVRLAKFLFLRLPGLLNGKFWY